MVEEEQGKVVQIIWKENNNFVLFYLFIRNITNQFVCWFKKKIWISSFNGFQLSFLIFLFQNVRTFRKLVAKERT